MGNTRRSKDNPPKRRPANSPEERENQLISAAVDLAERQIRDGTASAQVISHYIKLGSTRERLEQQRLRGENALLEARRERLEGEKKVEELYDKALRAMKRYSGEEMDDDEEYYD